MLDTDKLCSGYIVRVYLSSIASIHFFKEFEHAKRYIDSYSEGTQFILERVSYHTTWDDEETIL